MRAKVRVSQLNETDREGFVAICGPFFENSPWIAERAFEKRPFATRQALHHALTDVMYSASRDEQVKLICAHPDLVGRLAREGGLTRESTCEQAAAGLDALKDEEIAAFDRYNRAYRDKFGFPFVICARQNKKDAILAAFPQRLEHSRETEIQTALNEISKIAQLRLHDAVDED